MKSALTMFRGVHLYNMNKLTFLLGFLLFAGLTNAQKFELRVQALDNGNLAVQMQEIEGLAPSMDDLIGDFTFGLVWSTADCANANTLEVSVEQSDYNIIPAMAKFTKSDDLIQAFRVSTAPFAFPQDWSSDEFVTVAELKVNSSASCPLNLAMMNHANAQHSDLLVATQPNITIAYADNGVGRDFQPEIVESGVVSTTETLVETRLQAFPNPTSDILNVRFDAPTNARAAVRLYNVVGQLMLERELQLTAGQNEFTLDGTKLPKGNYLLNIISENTQVSRKVVLID